MEEGLEGFVLGRNRLELPKVPSTGSDAIVGCIQDDIEETSFTLHLIEKSRFYSPSSFQFSTFKIHQPLDSAIEQKSDNISLTLHSL